MLDQRDSAEFGGATARCHTAISKWRVAYGLDRSARGCGVTDMRYLDALYTHIQQPEDEGRIEPRRAYDRRHPDAFGCHHRKLHIVQVEACVLHVDEGRIKAGKPDQLDDLRVSDPAHMGSQGE